MLHIIANPASSSGTGRLRIIQLMKGLKKNHIDALLHLTKHKGHASQLAKKLHLTSEDQLLIIGGDGSINELVNGLHLPYPAPILLSPSGSGNDFARGMGISHSRKDLLKILNNPSEHTPHQTDLGTVSSISADSENSPSLRDHRFCVSCGLGMDAAICHALEKGKLKRICNRLHIGKVSYLITGVKVLLSTGKEKRAELNINADGKILHTKNTAFISVHNLPYEGGGFPFAPDASPEDGFLDVCIVHVPNRFLMIPLLIACLVGGRHTRFPKYVTSLRCSRIQVTSDRPLPLHTDGEVALEQTGFTASAIKGPILCIR